MRTLTVHTADELVERWKRRAIKLLADPTDDYFEGMAQGYRVCAAELMGILAVAMEQEAAHHDDPEPPDDVCQNPDHGNHRFAVGAECMSWDNPADPNALLEWSQGQRP